MPTYEYECKHCGHKLEAFQSITDVPLTRCPKCRKKGLRRLISPGAGIIFKGPGFYATDYRGSSSGSSDTRPSKSNREKAESDSPAE